MFSVECRVAGKTKTLCALFAIMAITTFGGGCKPMGNAKLGDGLFAVFEVAGGTITAQLFYEEAPLTVVNFVGLAEGTLDAHKGKKFYDGLKFHRVISRANGDGQDFMIQGGDPRGNGTGGPGYAFADEFVDSLDFSKPGMLAMANSGPATNGSQFFITIAPTPWLNGKHTIFGKVVDGQKVVDKTKQGDVIKSVKIVRNGKDAEGFSATQQDFDRLAKEAEKKASAAKEKQFASQIAEIEKKFPGYDKDSNGIYYKTTKTGYGEKTGKGKHVAADYKGYLIDGTVFDSSAGREPLEFVTASGQMIPGFDIMVQDMQAGEARTVVLPPNLAYGERGYPGVIPPNAYLAFDIVLVRN